ncbi:hypothetical protein CMQ_760 [Grosmannia clavigera kw1407]|uniref:Uncharacterized protein n=1 Tax=Grosmannia clavigera (strain kw1407 / UAMH 11150) TaxID=655863 RepID=F0XCC0_GROCL|nr:uncharacterized protein CMQ_760 [Grosmannia clavigera kw1407]EFX03832.1 hypothetical protein CMQ_760 [Grosmannia clavigera kw1407]
MESFVPVTGLAELDQHLDSLLAATAASIGSVLETRPLVDARLFDSVELQLSDANIPVLAPRLLPKIVAVLQQQSLWPADPAAHRGEGDRAADILSSMATKLLGPVRFGDVFALASEADLVAALGADAAPATNVLAMTVVHKAVVGDGAETADNLRRLTGMYALITAFLTRWLAAPAAEVGEKGGRVLGDLLDVDCPLAPPSQPENTTASTPMINGTRTITVEEPMGGGGVLPTLRLAPGPGVLWRLFFRDGLFYDRLAAICGGGGDHDGRAAYGDDPRVRLQRTIAQGRVLRVVPRLASLNLAAVASEGAASTSASPDVLSFVALHMVDRSDRLMHLSLVDFFETLVSVMRVAVLSTTASANAAYAVEVLRGLLRSATAHDTLLADALQSLPDRTVPEEAVLLREWLAQLIPSAAPRVTGWP